MPGIANPWERLPDEPQAAYEAALVYFKLGTSRSLAAVQRQQSGGKKAANGSRSSTYSRWSKAHRWVERADAWDRHVAAMTAKAHEDAARLQGEASAALWAERQKQYVEALWTPFELAILYQRDVLARRTEKKPLTADEVALVIGLMTDARILGREALAVACPAAIKVGPATGSTSITTEEAAAGLKAILAHRDGGKA